MAEVRPIDANALYIAVRSLRQYDIIEPGTCFRTSFGLHADDVLTAIQQAPTVGHALVAEQKRVEESTMREKALEWLYGQLKQTRVALGHAEHRNGVKQPELDDFRGKIDVVEWLCGVALAQPDRQQPSRKAENCMFCTPNGFRGAGCLGTKELDPCKGVKCENWKAKEGVE